MNLTKRLDAVEASLAQQTGDFIRCFTRKDDTETDKQARERLGLSDWPGVLILMDESDARL